MAERHRHCAQCVGCGGAETMPQRMIVLTDLSVLYIVLFLLGCTPLNIDILISCVVIVMSNVVRSSIRSN